MAEELSGAEMKIDELQVFLQVQLNTVGTAPQWHPQQ